MRHVPIPPAALQWLSTHHQVISAQQLRRLGVSEHGRRRFVDDGLFIRVAKGVYRVASAPDSLAAQAVALSLAHPTGFVTGPSAGKLLGLFRMPRTPVHYSVPHGHELDLPGAVLRQSRAIVPLHDIRVRPDGIRIATPWRLAFDLAADLEPLDHRSVVEQMLRDGMCGIRSLVSVAKRLADPHRPGSQRFLDTLDSRLPGGPLDSHPEVVLAAALQARGIPVVAQQTWLQLPNGRRIRIDLSVEDICWGLEIDVHPHHFLDQGTWTDRQRDRQCHLIGWQTDRVTRADLLDLDALVDELVEIYQRRVADIQLLRRARAEMSTAS